MIPISIVFDRLSETTGPRPVLDGRGAASLAGSYANYAWIGAAWYIGTSEMPYEYDLFVSYMHDGQMESWVGQHLIPFLRSFVGNALNRPASIFFDRTGIRSGESWPLRLQQALAKSRCLVAVWSPLYFHSEWCRRECAVMFLREAQSGLRTAQAPGGLIVPVNVFDGQLFPKKARDVQWLDCQKYWIVGEGFVKTERYVEFQDALRSWSVDVAAVVRSAPAWDERWLTSPWIEVPDMDLMPVPPENFSFVGLE